MRVFANQEPSVTRHRALPSWRGTGIPRRPSGVAFSAMAEPTTRRAFRRHGHRAASMLASSAALWVATAVTTELAPDTTDAPVQIICLALVTAAAVALTGGLLMLAGWLRMGRLLRTHPWTVWECTPVPGTDGGTTIRLGPDGQYPVVLVTYGEPTEGFADAGVVWLAGSPERGGVLTPDGGDHLTLCRPADG